MPQFENLKNVTVFTNTTASLGHIIVTKLEVFIVKTIKTLQ